MIRNILFDCADTLLRFHSKEDLASGLGDPARAERIHNALLRSEIWGKYDNGIVDEDEIKRVVLPTLPEEDREIAVDYLEGFIHHFTPFDGMEDLLKDLKKKGYALYLVSDFPHKFTVLWETFDLFRLFDGRAVSFEAKGSKRDGKLFDYVLKTYGLNPAECFFVDDLDSLIAKAGTCGIRGHVFQGVAELRRYFEQEEIL